MRLIDADVLIKQIKDNMCKPCRERKDDYKGVRCKACQYGDEKDDIDSAPTAQPGWIPCSERLPDNEKRVLCTVQSGEHFIVVTCIFIQHTRRWLPEVYGNHDNVIAWMPLPEPWNGGQDD